MRLGGNIQNPLTLYTGVDKTDAGYVLEIIFTVFAVFYAQLAWALCYVLDLELLPFRLKMPQISFAAVDRPVPQYDADSDKYSLGQTRPLAKPPGKERHGIPHSERRGNIWASLGSSICSAACARHRLSTTTSTGAWVQGSSTQQMAWLVNLLVPLGAGVLFFVYCYFRPDPCVFGGRRDFYEDIGFGKESAKTLEAETRRRVLRQIVPIVLLMLCGTLFVGGARMIWTSTDNNWLVGVGYFAALLL